MQILVLKCCLFSQNVNSVTFKYTIIPILPKSTLGYWGTEPDGGWAGLQGQANRSQTQVPDPFSHTASPRGRSGLSAGSAPRSSLLLRCQAKATVFKGLSRTPVALTIPAPPCANSPFESLAILIHFPLQNSAQSLPP